jgi:hypothetical protein
MIRDQKVALAAVGFEVGLWVTATKLTGSSMLIIAVFGLVRPLFAADKQLEIE